MKKLLVNLIATIGTVLLGAVLLRSTASYFAATHSHVADISRSRSQGSRPQTLITGLGADLSGIRLCISGPLYGCVSRSAASKLLGEIRARVRSRWTEFGCLAYATPFPENEATLVRRIDGGMKALGEYSGRVDAALKIQDNRTILLYLLNADWPVIQSEIVRPLQDLHALQNETAEQNILQGLATAQILLVSQGSLLLLLAFIVAGLLLRFSALLLTTLQPSTAMDPVSDALWNEPLRADSPMWTGIIEPVLPAETVETPAIVFSYRADDEVPGPGEILYALEIQGAEPFGPAISLPAPQTIAAEEAVRNDGPRFKPERELVPPAVGTARRPIDPGQLAVAL